MQTVTRDLASYARKAFLEASWEPFGWTSGAVYEICVVAFCQINVSIRQPFLRASFQKHLGLLVVDVKLVFHMF